MNNLNVEMGTKLKKGKGNRINLSVHPEILKWLKVEFPALSQNNMLCKVIQEYIALKDKYEKQLK